MHFITWACFRNATIDNAHAVVERGSFFFIRTIVFDCKLSLIKLSNAVSIVSTIELGCHLYGVIRVQSSLSLSTNWS